MARVLPTGGSSAPSLRELLVRSSEGDTESFERLYDATVSRVYGLVLRRLSSRAEAEQVTQHVYVTLWRQAGAIAATDCHPLAWIVSLAHHEAVQHRPSSRPALAVSEQLQVGVGDQGSTVVLSRTQQEILTLVYLGGYSPRQVAELLQLERMAVATALRVGLRTIAPTLGVPS